MEILDNSIILFKNITPISLLNELDLYYKDAHVDDRVLEQNGTDVTNQNINKFIKSVIEPKMLDYFIDLTHESRPDLQQYSWNYQLDREEYQKTGKIYNTLRNYIDLSIRVSCFRFIHRNNCLNDINYVKWMGDMNKFTFVIGMSNEADHVSVLRFPIQKVELQLNRGDILVAPAGITHPFIINGVQNGIFKFIETV